MGLFGKKPDPISVRARELNREIAELEGRIRKLKSRPEPPPKPRATRPAVPNNNAAASEPVFEKMPARPVRPAVVSTPTDAAHYNEMGVRKYDLVALFRKLRDQFRGPPASNPKLVQLIAAGNIHGLRPLRYEKRVARNRFIVVATVLILVILGILAMLRR